MIELELRRGADSADWPACRPGPPTALSTTGSPAGADEATIAPVASRMKARPFVPTAWLRSSAASSSSRGVGRRRRTRQVVVQPHADVRRRFLVERRRQHRRIVVGAAQGDRRRGADHDEHQRDERREDEDPDRQTFLDRVATPGVSLAGFPDPVAAANRRAPSPVPGISAQNHPNRLASGSATKKATGPRSQVMANVKNSAEEMFR